MFTQRISMDCTREQYEKYLKDELLKMGYEEWTIADDHWGVIVNNCGGDDGRITNLPKDRAYEYGRTYLGSFNAPLLLALAAMTDNPTGNYREYYTNGIDFFCLPFTSGVYYCGIWRKATKEKIMAKFGKTEPDTNYDAAKEFVKDFCYKTNNLKVAAICDNIHQFTKKAIEKENAIKLLRENGYKILKPKTWEEV